MTIRQTHLLLAILLALAAGIPVFVWAMLSNTSTQSGIVNIPDSSFSLTPKEDGSSSSCGDTRTRSRRGNQSDLATGEGDAGSYPGSGGYQLPPEKSEHPHVSRGFVNSRIVWKLPIESPGAERLNPQAEYDGTPVFTSSWIFREPGMKGFRGTFDPARPDGMLIIDVSDYGASLEPPMSSATVDVISDDGKHIYTYSVSNPGTIRFAVPYSYARMETVGVRITGPSMLPIEAVVSQTAGTHLRRQILVEGRAWLRLRSFHSSYADLRSIHVRDDGGNNVSGALLTCDGIQILGRADSSGVLAFPWPQRLQDVPEHESIQEKYFFVSAPGYVPVLLERSALENADGPFEVTLKARELLISAYELVPHPEVLHLGANLDHHSSILQRGIDLIPIPDDYPAIEDWSDFHRALFGRNGKWYDRHRENGDLPEFPEFETGGTAPYKPGHKFGGEGASKLAEVLGRQPTEHWPEYAHWYYGRWDYDEREGRFDVVLPFPGRFLLAVGEFNHGVKGDERNGGLTHVLYIDARNPAALRSKLLIHPQG